MGSKSICKGDPFVSFIREEFNATPISKPEERFQPLTVFSWYKKKADYIGFLNDLLLYPKKFSPKILPGQVSDFSNLKSQSVQTNFGLELLGSFQSFTGIDLTPLKPSFSSIRLVSFSFKNVKRLEIHKSQLGDSLLGNKLNLSNISLYPFKQNPKIKFMVINSIFTASTVTFNSDKGGDFELESSIVEKLVKNSNGMLRIQSSRKRKLILDHDVDIPFAFTSFELEIDWESGEFIGIKNTTKDAPIPLSDQYSPKEEILLLREDELFFFDS